MRVFIVLVMLAAGAVVIVLQQRASAKASRLSELSQEAERVAVQIIADNEGGICDFGNAYRSYQINVELAELRGGQCAPYPFTRTSGVVSLDEVPAYLAEKQVPVPTAD